MHTAQQRYYVTTQVTTIQVYSNYLQDNSVRFLLTKLCTTPHSNRRKTEEGTREPSIGEVQAHYILYVVSFISYHYMPYHGIAVTITWVLIHLLTIEWTTENFGVLHTSFRSTQHYSQLFRSHQSHPSSMSHHLACLIHLTWLTAMKVVSIRYTSTERKYGQGTI